MMKLSISSIILLFLSTTAFANHHAGNKIYGDFRLSYQKQNTRTSTMSTNGLSVVNNASRLGFKGATEHDGLEAFYHFQLGAVNDNPEDSIALTSRFYFAGLKHKFGTVKMGRLSTPYKMVGVKMDNFYDTSAGKSAGGATFGLSGLNNGFTDNSLVYVSPSFMGVTVTLATYIDDSDVDQNDYNLGLTYANNGINAGIQRLAVNTSAVVAGSTSGKSATRYHAGYNADMFNVGVSYEDFETNATYTYVNAAFMMGSGKKVAASYGAVSDTGSKSTDGTGYTLGYFCDVMPKTTAHVLASRVDHDDNQSKTDTLAVGFSFKFGGML